MVSWQWFWHSLQVAVSVVRLKRESSPAHETGGHAVVGGPGAQGRAEAAHEAGDVGTHHLPAGEQLEGPQHRVIEEGTALDRDPLAELVGVLELDDLVQGVAHHRVGQARTDLPHRGRLALGLLDPRSS